MGPRAYESGTFGLLEGGIWQKCLRRRAEIETARFNNGLFLNYLGYGILLAEMKAKAMEPTLEELQAGGGYAKGGDEALEDITFEGDMHDGEGAFFMSLKNAIAEMPIKEDGSWARIGMTSVRDIGRFVVASLDLHRWALNCPLCGECSVFSGSSLWGDCSFCGEYSLFSEWSLGGECSLSGEYSLLSECSLSGGCFNPAARRPADGGSTVAMRCWKELPKFPQ
jgi:hypothetical protein